MSPVRSWTCRCSCAPAQRSPGSPPWRCAPVWKRQSPSCEWSIRQRRKEELLRCPPLPPSPPSSPAFLHTMQVGGRRVPKTAQTRKTVGGNIFNRLLVKKLTATRLYFGHIGDHLASVVHHVIKRASVKVYISFIREGKALLARSNYHLEAWWRESLFCTLGVSHYCSRVHSHNSHSVFPANHHQAKQPTKICSGRWKFKLRKNICSILQRP